VAQLIDLVGDKLLQRAEPLQLLRLVGEQRFQRSDLAVDSRSGRAIGFQVGSLLRQQLAALAGFCIGEFGQQVVGRIDRVA